MAGALVVAFLLGWLVASSRRSAIDHVLEGTKGLPPRPAPPPPARPLIDDPSLSPDQFLALNSRRPNSSGGDGGGWPT